MGAGKTEAQRTSADGMPDPNADGRRSCGPVMEGSRRCTPPSGALASPKPCCASSAWRLAMSFCNRPARRSITQRTVFALAGPRAASDMLWSHSTGMRALHCTMCLVARGNGCARHLKHTDERQCPGFDRTSWRSSCWRRRASSAASSWEGCLDVLLLPSVLSGLASLMGAPGDAVASAGTAACTARNEDPLQEPRNCAGWHRVMQPATPTPACWVRSCVFFLR